MAKKDVSPELRRVERLAADAEEQARVWSDAAELYKGIGRHLHNPIFRAELWCMVLQFERLQ